MVLYFPFWPHLRGLAPPSPDIQADLNRLHAQMEQAPTAEVAVGLTGALWELWLQAPDDTAQELLGQGMQFRETGNYDAAEWVLTELITYCPNYAEDIINAPLPDI